MAPRRLAETAFPHIPASGSESGCLCEQGFFAVKSFKAEIIEIDKPSPGHFFLCPGERTPVSGAVHLSRLAAGWHGCRECVWSEDSGGKKESTLAAEKTFFHDVRRQIRRTESGLRGAYLNAIDRPAISLLAAIITTHMVQMTQSAVTDPGESDHTDSDQVSPMSAGAQTKSTPPQIVVGYDDSPGAPDLFAGLTSAVLQNGCDVLDAGRCSPASLMHVCRRSPAAIGTMLVTGTGGLPGDAGIDIIGRDGKAISIPWQKFGLSIRTVDSAMEITPGADNFLPRVNDESTTGAYVSQQQNRSIPQTPHAPARLSLPDRLQQVRKSARATSASNLKPHFATQPAVLIIPDQLRGRRASFRSVRRAGQRKAAMSEVLYRDWIVRWWPRNVATSISFQVSDALTVQRLEWLASNRMLNLQIERLRSGEKPRTAKTQDRHLSGKSVFNPGPVVQMPDDDRFAIVCTQRGRIMAAKQLADWINGTNHPLTNHVTAHAGRDGRGVVLVDIPSPDSGTAQEIICDGLAVAGLVLTLLQRYTLPV